MSRPVSARAAPQGEGRQHSDALASLSTSSPPFISIQHPHDKLPSLASIVSTTFHRMPSWKRSLAGTSSPPSLISMAPGCSSSGHGLAR